MAKKEKAKWIPVSPELYDKIQMQMRAERRPGMQNMTEWMILKYMKHAPAPKPEPSNKTLSEILK